MRSWIGFTAFRICAPIRRAMKKWAGIPAITEVRFSITHNRGCFGGCNFCALAFHQGRTGRSRSVQSVVAEAQLLTTLPDFKGYIHDVGGPTANFRYPSCDKQKTAGVCPNRKCLAPTPCKHLRADHSEYLTLLQKIKALPGIKKVFIRSGLRYDYLLCDQTGAGDAFFKELVRDHVSGQLKVAPEHCSDAVLRDMGKPPIAVFERFKQRYFQLCASMHKEQYLVPYLMSSHPGSTLHDAVVLAQYLKEWGYSPQQVQDFYPTPGTASTVMFYTGIDPFTQKEVYVPRTREEKQLQRALLQFSRPQNAALVRKALHMAHREDLIGFSLHCLVPPAGGKPLQHTVRVARGHDASVTRRTTNAGRVSNTTTSFGSHQKKAGWAKAKPKRKKPGKNKK